MQRTPNLSRHLEQASKTSQKNNRPNNVVDLFAQLLKEGKFKNLLAAFGINADAVAVSLTEKLPDVFPKIFEDCEKEYNEVLKEAEESSELLGFGFFDTEHLFHELLNSSATIKSFFAIYEFPIDKILEKTEDMLTLNGGYAELSKELSEPDFPTIEKFCKNLSFEYGTEPEKTFGRGEEISNILDILCRHKKGNAILIGDPGVGRKSIIRGVIEKINSGKSSEVLREKTFYQLDVTAIVAGTSMFGSIENRFKNLAEELEGHGSAVLVIPDFQVVSGSGFKEGPSDVSNFLKSILARPNVSCLATTTQGDYKKHIEKDPSMTNLFEVIKVKEPTKEETRQILVNSIHELEECHYVEFPTETIDMVLDLCEKYLPYRRFPEKAFDTLDFLGARAKNEHFTHPPALHEEWLSIIEKVSPDLKKDSPEFDKLNRRLEKWSKKLNKWMEDTDRNIPIISPAQAISTFAEKHKITENQLKQLQTSGIDGLAEKLKAAIFGQDHAIDKVCDVLLCSKVGLRDKNKPLGKFMFVGSTSTGKAQPLYSKIKTKNGWTTMGEVSVGDKILDTFGQEQVVEAIFPQESLQKVFEIQTRDGRICRASENHLWRVYNRHWGSKGSRWKILNTIEIQSFLEKGKDIYIELPYQSYKDCSDDVELPIHPYVLGVLLGDGHFGKTIGISSNDPQIVDICKSLIGDNQEIVKEKGDNYDFYFRERKPVTNRQNKKGVVLTKIKMDLDKLGLQRKRSWEKFIPTEYMSGGFQQRLDMLNGLLDTDGTINKNGSISITTSSFQLAKDIQKLAWSIGAVSNFYSYSVRKTYTYKGEKRIGREHFRVSIRHANPSIFFRLQRKRDRIPAIYRYENPSKGTQLKVQLKAVDYIGEEQTKCIKVSSSNSLYITDNFIVTHNTETAKQLAANYFGDEKALLKLDMSEFSERFSASSLIGTTAGYIGYENGGRLTEFVKHNPSCVVLFDEIEKADRSIHNLLLQIMDDGYLTDGQGFKVDFTNTIVILTTNSGSEPPKSLGFNAEISTDHHEKAAKKDFAPEFRARVDEIVVFKDMDDKMMTSILDKFLNQTVEKLKDSGVSVLVEDGVRQALLKEIKSQNSHSREIQTTVRRKLDVPLAKFIIDKRPKTITVRVENNKIELS